MKNNNQSSPEIMISDFLMQLSNEPILILNTDFTIARANDSFFKTTGKSASSVIGSYCYQAIYGLDIHCFSAKPGYACPVLETLRSGESSHVIHEIPVSGAGSTYYNVVSYPIKNTAGDVTRIIEIWQDLTHEFHSRMEKRSRRLKDDLNRMVNEERIMSLGKLAASCVHEINNPIQGLLTFSRLMENILSENSLEKNDIEDMRRYTMLMSGELERCGNIVSGLLSFARETSMTHTDIVFNDLVQGVITLTQHKMLLQNIQLNLNISKHPMMIQGDKNQIQQCLLNIIFNAMEAMPEGGELCVSAKPGKQKNKTCIEIQDTGEGISPENLDNIFDPFFTTKADGQGTGLGLSIVYGVVKGHGGEIQVKSVPDKGTRFILEFPMCQFPIDQFPIDQGEAP
ncbi:ATP-binding protein [Desulfobacterales bacterium HSG17]|nr:ATP-binding protein [Desulfobacterales bacterium HSG17]